MESEYALLTSAVAVVLTVVLAAAIDFLFTAEECIELLTAWLVSGGLLFILQSLTVMGENKMANLHTVTNIAKALGEHVGTVRYVISYHSIEAVERAGLVRLFDDAQVAVIKSLCFNLQVQKRR